MAGRGKKKEISPEDMARAEEYALQGCKNNTICTLMGWNEHFLEDRKDILKKLTKKRAERKLAIRESQFANRKQPVMSIWLGKNELGQTDKSEITGKGRMPLAAPLIQIMPPSVETQAIMRQNEQGREVGSEIPSNTDS